MCLFSKLKLLKSIDILIYITHIINKYISGLNSIIYVFFLMKIFDYLFFKFLNNKYLSNFYKNQYYLQSFSTNCI